MPLTQSQQADRVKKALDQRDLTRAAEAIFDAGLVSEKALHLILRDPEAKVACRERVSEVARKRQGRAPLEEALCDAAANGKESKARLLIEAGALLNNASSASVYFSLMASRVSLPRKLRLAKLLIDQGASLLASDRYGRLTLLEICALPIQSALPAAKLLLDAGARPDTIALAPRFVLEHLSNDNPFSQKTPGLRVSSLMAASILPSFELARLLLESDSSLKSVSVVDDWDRSALHWAAQAGSEQACHYLIDLGLDPLTPDRGGQNAIDLAQLNSSEFAERLYAAGERKKLGHTISALAQQRASAFRL